MTKGILYAVLLACSLAMLMFLAGFTGWQLGLFRLAEWCYGLAGKTMLLAFAVLLLLGCGLLLLAVVHGFSGYFHREQRILRHLSRLKAQHRHVGQRTMLEKSQQFYWSQFKRQRLLAANDKKHSLELFKAIEAELKKNLEPEVYKVLRRDLQRFYQQSNPQAMLSIRDQALCRTSGAG